METGLDNVLVVWLYSFLNKLFGCTVDIIKKLSTFSNLMLKT